MLVSVKDRGGASQGTVGSFITYVEHATKWQRASSSWGFGEIGGYFIEGG